MQQSALETNNQSNNSAAAAGMPVDLWAVVRENARMNKGSQQKVIVGPATIIVMRPRTKSYDKDKTLAAFTASHLQFPKTFLKATEETKTPHPNVPLQMQAAAAAYAARDD